MSKSAGSRANLSRSLPTSSPPQAWTVSGLTRYLQGRLDSDPSLQDLWLSGEASNVSRSAAGHLYFTLKDAEAALHCVMWQEAAARLTWRLEQGAAVLVHGRLSIYPAQGRYQLYVDQVRPAGQGDLYARFIELRDRLRAEGLFEAERKRPVPSFPRTLGVVTSPQAAALRDVLQILRRRYPLVRVILAPTLVQGEQAPAQIVAALQAVDSLDDVDVILLVRGGGSLEELWAFNDERVARAIAACRHPVVCGVGHETDFTIADMVADLRAPTPSAAAEQAVPDQAALRTQIATRRRQLDQLLAHRLKQARQSLSQQQGALRRLSPLNRIQIYRQQVDDFSRRASRALGHRMSLARSTLVGYQERLAALNPLAILERGYAIVRRTDTRQIVSHVDQVGEGDRIGIRVADGEFGAVVRMDSER